MFLIHLKSCIFQEFHLPVMKAAALQRSKRVRHPKLSSDFVYQLPVASKRSRKHSLTGGAVDSPIDHPQEEQTSGFQFHELPAEIILQVLKYLPIKGLVAASCVCKKWRKLCKDSSLWKCVSFEGTEVDRLQWNFWKRLEKLGTTCLDLHACVNPVTSAPRKAIHSIIKLTIVRALYLGVIEKADLLTIVENMPQLKILHVICLLPPLSRSSESMVGRDGSILYDVGKLSVLKDLEELKLSSVYSLCVPTISFSGGMSALEELTKLKKLVIVKTILQVLSNFEGIARDDLCFLKNLPHLEHLELGNCSNFSHFSLVYLREMENLKSLSLTQANCLCYEVPCTCIGMYLKELKKLRKLTLIMCCIPKDLAEFLQELPELKSFEIWPYLDNVFIPLGEDKDQERFAGVYASVFRGLEHLPSITVGILEKSICGLYNPFEREVYDWIADKRLETHFSRFCHYEEEKKEEDFIDKIWDRYNLFLLGGDEEEERREAGMTSDEGTSEDWPGALSGKHQGAWSGRLQGDHQENGEATPAGVKKSQERGIKRGKEKNQKMGTYDMIKCRLIDLLPSTRLTFYRVKMSKSSGNADTEMFYISRKEEHFNMPVLSQT